MTLYFKREEPRGRPPLNARSSSPDADSSVCSCRFSPPEYADGEVAPRHTLSGVRSAYRAQPWWPSDPTSRA